MLGFDHHTVEFASDWREIYAGLRRESPVARSDAQGGFVVVTRNADVRRVLTDSQTFVCRREVEAEGLDAPVAGGVTIPQNPFRMGMMEMDPPQSTFFRKILMPWFSAKAIEAAEDHIRDLVDSCLDRVIADGRMDVVDDLANPLPALVTLDLLGLPLTNWERYGVILHQAAYREKGSAKQLAWLQDDLRTVMRERRSAPAATPSPVDALLAAQDDDGPLPLDVAVEMVFMLLTGGIDTSTGLIAHGIRHLSAHPAQRDRLAADPSLVPAAVDEMLRYFTPGTSVARTALADTEIGGCPVHAGERVFLALGSANTDPDAFEHADSVDLGRESNKHLAFGLGVHRCLGAFLARTEMTLVLQQVLKRIPDLHVDEEGVVAYETIPNISGFRAMPATFTPGAPVTPAGDAGTAA